MADVVHVRAPKITQYVKTFSNMEQVLSEWIIARMLNVAPMLNTKAQAKMEMLQGSVEALQTAASANNTSRRYREFCVLVDGISFAGWMVGCECRTHQLLTSR
jgi:hypothetical protein